MWDEITYPFLKKFHPTLYWARNYLSILGLKLNPVSKKMAPRRWMAVHSPAKKKIIQCVAHKYCSAAQRENE